MAFFSPPGRQQQKQVAELHPQDCMRIMRKNAQNAVVVRVYMKGSLIVSMKKRIFIVVCQVPSAKNSGHDTEIRTELYNLHSDA